MRFLKALILLAALLLAACEGGGFGDDGNFTGGQICPDGFRWSDVAGHCVRHDVYQQLGG